MRLDLRRLGLLADAGDEHAARILHRHRVRRGDFMPLWRAMMDRGDHYNAAALAMREGVMSLAHHAVRGAWRAGREHMHWLCGCYPVRHMHSLIASYGNVKVQLRPTRQPLLVALVVVNDEWRDRWRSAIQSAIAALPARSIPRERPTQNATAAWWWANTYLGRTWANAALVDALCGWPADEIGQDGPRPCDRPQMLAKGGGDE